MGDEERMRKEIKRYWRSRPRAAFAPPLPHSPPSPFPYICVSRGEEGKEGVRYKWRRRRRGDNQQGLDELLSKKIWIYGTMDNLLKRRNNGRE